MGASEQRQAVCPTDAAALAALMASLPDGGEVPLLVTGESMVPFYRHAETVVVLRKETARPPRRGDAVLFLRTDGTPVLHRIVKVTHGALTVGGDGQRFAETVQPDRILARVVRVRRCVTAREASTDAPCYRLLVFLWSRGRFWHPRAAKWWRTLSRTKSRRQSRERRRTHERSAP